MAIDKTNLTTQVQARIDGLTGAETLKDLLILSKAAEGLSVNRTALDNAIETALGGLDGASEVKDLLVGNKSAADEVATLLGVNNHTTAEINRANTHTTSEANGIKTHIDSALSGAGGSVIKSVQRGTTSLASNRTNRTVSISFINMTKAVLLFSWTFDGSQYSSEHVITALGSSLVMGRISSNTLIEFGRTRTNESSIDINWQVIEYV